MKKIIAIILALIMVVCFAGCGNMDMLDMVYTYDRAIIQLADGEVIEVNIKQWCTYEGEQIQIIAEDGTVYLTNSYRCDLIQY
jgi:uncharacterized lipoprotein YehR (DUF1307 family)